MSQKDFLENQVIEEILRERANYYTSKGITRDFWVINSPKFIDAPEIKNKIAISNFYKQKKSAIQSTISNRTYNFYSAIITCDFEFIKWIQLRLGYFEDIKNLAITNKTTNNSYVSDGIFGEIENGNSFLDYSSDYLHPDILINRYKKSIEIYYK